MILPRENKKDLIDIPKKVKKEMNFIFVEDVKDVFNNALDKSFNNKAKSQKRIA